MTILQVDIASIMVWGFVATVVLTVIMFASQALGLSRMSLPFMLGTVFTADRTRAEVCGLIGHFLMGWAFTVIYALLFESIQLANWWFGTILAIVHGLFILLVVMPILPNVHPRMANEHDGPVPTRMLEPPGFMGFHYGRQTPVTTLLAHAAFGFILGLFYQLGA